MSISEILNSDLFLAIKAIWSYKVYKIDNNFITMGSLIVGFICFIVGLYIAKKLSRKIGKLMAERGGVDRNVRNLIQSISFYIFVIISFLSALKFAHIPIAMFTVLGGALAIGVGFGTQNIVRNFISGVILMIEQPIKIGNFIEIDGFFGEVEKIGMRSTYVKTAKNSHVIVPNSTFLEKNVLNWTCFNTLVRSSISVGVAYGSDTDLVKKTLIEATETEKSISKVYPVSAFLIEFSDSALLFQLDFWINIKGLTGKKLAESNIRCSIDKLFKENNIEIPFPRRDIHLHKSDTSDLGTASI